MSDEYDKKAEEVLKQFFHNPHGEGVSLPGLISQALRAALAEKEAEANGLREKLKEYVEFERSRGEAHQAVSRRYLAALNRADKRRKP